MMAGTGVSVGGAGMLRTRRRDVSVKPNRKLDRKSSRGMIYENEELRLRTIHINAEVEQGQNDIKKLRRENEQLRREIWSLRDEYDKLEEILKRQKSREESEEYEDRSDEDEEEPGTEFSGEEETEEADNPAEALKEEQLENAENQKISSEKMSSVHRLHVDFDDLSVVDEEEEIKKEKEKEKRDDKEEAKGQQRPRQLHENIPFYPGTYESPNNTFSGSSYYTDCPFEFPSTIDLMLPPETPGLLASPCPRLHPDPPLEQDRLLNQMRLPGVGWQAGLMPQQDQLANYQTVNVTTAGGPTGIQQLFGVPPSQAQLEQPFRIGSSFLQRRRQPGGSFEPKPMDPMRMQRQASEKPITENGWGHEVRQQGESKTAEEKNLEGIFTFDGSDRPKHFFSPLPSKTKRETSPTASPNQFGTGNSSSSGKTGSTVVSKGQYSSQKGSADIYVNGAVPCEDAGQRDEQRTFLSTDNLLINEDKSSNNQLTKSMSCQDLVSESHSTAISEQLKMNHGEGKHQMTQSDNALDSHKDTKSFRSHLNVTLRMPKASQLAGPATPEIPKLPTIDYRIFKNPFLRNFEQGRNYLDQSSPATRPLSVQVNDDNNFCYHYPGQSFNRFQPEDRTRPHGKPDQRLLIPSNQLIDGQLMSPMNNDIQVTSFERPSPHTLIPPATPYDLATLRKINGNPYLQNRGLYQNLPFVPRTHLYQGPSMRMYYDSLALKVPAQTQTSIDGDSHQDDEQISPRQDGRSPETAGSPTRRRRTIKKDKTQTKPLSPGAQRRLKKQSSLTSSETPESPSKLAGKRPRRVSVTTTTTSEAQEEKNESRSSSSGQDSPRKDQTRRVSLYFNAKKRPSLSSVKTARSGSLETGKDKYVDGGGSNGDRERTNSVSSRELVNAKARKTSTSSGKVPWCACWGNGCI